MPEKILKIKKRSGEIVDFESEKIQRAIYKAFEAVTGSATHEVVDRITLAVVSNLEDSRLEETPTVENVQDLVEKELMQEGAFSVAKAYILYRYEHQKQREEKKQEVIKKIEERQLLVTKRDGRTEKFSSDKLTASFIKMAGELAGSVDTAFIINQTQSELYDGILTKDVAKALLMTVRALMEQDTVYSHIASRLLLNNIYKEVVGEDKIDYSRLEEQYREAFIENIKEGVQLEKLSSKLLEFDLEKLSRQLVIERDDAFRYLGIQTLFDRYFISSPRNKRILETPQAFWMRVAMGLAIEEEDKMGRTLEFYNII